MTIYFSNPYRRMNALRQAMDRLLEEGYTEAATNPREMNLAVDVVAEDDSFTIRAFVPGLDADALDIEVLNSTVTIRGEFKDANAENAKYLANELPTGAFSRTVTLPTTLESSKAVANIKNGVLELKVPKAEAHRPKSIKVVAA
jgi:HSP20 family protein